MSIYANSFLHIVSFRTYRQTPSGGWTYATSLQRGKKYRFRFVVQNQWKAHLTDWAQIWYTQVRIWSDADPHFRYYKTSAFTGGSSNKFSIVGNDEWIWKDKKETLYVYFKWNSSDTSVASMSPIPIIGMSATEIRGMQNGPMANLQPNVV